MDKDEATKAGDTPKAPAAESPGNVNNPIENQKEDSEEENKMQEEKEEDITGTELGDSCPVEAVEIPEDPHPSLDKLCEDIERCMSSLPRPTEKDEKQEEEEEKDSAKDETRDQETNIAKNETREEKDENVEGIEDHEMDLVPDDLLKLVDKFLNWVDDICGEGRGRWGKVPDDDTAFLDAVDRMAKMRESLLSVSCMGLKFEERHGGLINRLSSIQHRATAYLEEEFRILLQESKTCTQLDHHHATTGGDDHNNSNKDKDNNTTNKGKNDPESSLPESESGGGENQGLLEFPGYSLEAVSNLNKIAKQMISGGYQFECCEVYLISRRHAFDENLHKLGLEKHSIDDIHKMHWEALEREIVAWVRAFKQCAGVYFSGERKLAESVFSDHPSMSACLYSNLSRGVVKQLLNFAEAIAMSKRSAEKLFKTLDMYEALKEVVPKMDDLFPEECVNELKTETTTVRGRLGEAAICIFCDLENSIKAETGRNPVPGGAVHPLTRYTMNYLRYACEYKDTLELVFKEHSKIERADSTSRAPSREEYDACDTSLAGGKDESPFSVQLMRVMDLLDSNLEAKSKLYKDVALSSIFMMNNGRYILQKIKGSPEINACMGDTWCRRRSSELRQYHKNYQRETWSRLLSILTHEGLSSHGKVMKPVLKERFKSFNAMFDEIHKTQSMWVVSDEQLQSELRVSISAVVIPAYRSFLGRFAQVFDAGRQTEKYIKFQPEDIETYIDELFDGNPNSSIFKKKP